MLKCITKSPKNLSEDARNKMKSKNRSYTNEVEYEDDYDNDKVKGKKLSDHRRRPIKNWKKVWAEHTSDYDEVDDFYTQNRR